MKKVFKILGFIALVVVIGFSMVSCGDDDSGDDSGGSNDGGGTIKIINNNSSPITKVTVHYTGSEGARPDDEFAVNISANGGT
jgi:hypothetical protein